ncbi:hypothetical protein F2Q68_00015065 [Brassica cretica]|uniref:Uncharacterized protein n=1 Tax=Brassica cretica TaxID=69181 RepID=A0A8S9HNJ7_BRACR|nr:hypothetical protein F2Q68_00015065 [Brassica cretica]
MTSPDLNLAILQNWRGASASIQTRARTYSTDVECLAWSSTFSIFSSGPTRLSISCFFRRWVGIPLILIQKGILQRKSGPGLGVHLSIETIHPFTNHGPRVSTWWRTAAREIFGTVLKSSDDLVMKGIGTHTLEAARKIYQITLSAVGILQMVAATVMDDMSINIQLELLRKYTVPESNLYLFVLNNCNTRVPGHGAKDTHVYIPNISVYPVTGPTSFRTYTAQAVDPTPFLVASLCSYLPWYAQHPVPLDVVRPCSVSHSSSGYARLLVSPSIDTKAVSSFDTKAVISIDTKAVLSIDVPSNPRQLLLARQKYYSSVKRA